jgi:hypothetical protein
MMLSVAWTTVVVGCFGGGGAVDAFVLSPTAARTARRTAARNAPSSVLSSSPSSISSSKPPAIAPLSPHTFAGQVEQRMIERFGGTEPIARVLESWRLLEHEYEHRAFVGDASVRDPQLSLSHQHCHSYVPGLKVKEFWDNQDFEWTNKLASKYQTIRKEFLAVTADMERLQQEGNNIWAGALTEDAGSYGTGWRTLVLMDRGRWDDVNVNLFPETAKAVHQAGVPAVEVFFASMKPETDIKSHSDFTNFVLTSHLALDIPYSGENKCRLRIGDTTRQWINGDVMVFDTSIMHDAINESDKTRYILMIRVWHPELTAVERDALQFIYDCLGYPDLLSPDADQRIIAERHVESLRAFPEIKRGIGASKGFGGGGKKASSKKKGKK